MNSRTRVALAVLLALLQALVPLAHRPAGAAGPGWIELCTADGLRRIAADEAPSLPGHDSDHCVLCRVAEPMAGLSTPAWSPSSGLPAGTRGAPPALFAGRPPPHDAPARAPPAAA
jgi:hypothetical protein